MKGSIFWVVALAVGSACAAPKQPNIVFLLADDMGYGDLGCYGHPFIQSPNLDALAKGGLQLTDCYAPSVNCSPSRAGILTGRSPYRVGMYDFAHYEPLHIPTNELTVAEVLKGVGYQTMFAGKWHCSGMGFDSDQPNPGDHGFDHWLANHTNFGQNPKSLYRNNIKVGPMKGWMSELVVDEALGWLAQRDPEKPFITMLWFSEPHTPVVAADEFKAPYRHINPESAAVKSLGRGGPQVKWKRDEGSRAAYYGCVTMLDHHIGRLIEYLDQNGLRENTLIVFTADNGPEHRCSSSFGSPRELRGAKGHMHEGGMRVPGIINWPGKISSAGNASFPICGTDFLPTFAALAGAEVPAEKPLDGINVWPSLLNSQAPARSKPILWWLFHARGGKEVAMRMGDYKLLANMTGKDPNCGDTARPAPGTSVMDFIKNAELENFAMYNLRADISETHDLVAEEPERFVQLRKQMLDLQAEIRSEGPVYVLEKKAKKGGQSTAPRTKH